SVFAGGTERATVVSCADRCPFSAGVNRTVAADCSPATSYTITTRSSPAAGGTTSGGGTKTSGSTATVVATAYAGYSFVNWTENGVAVSTSASYSFTVVANRNLVANFVAASANPWAMDI